MAVPKSKKSRSKRDSRRAHHRASEQTLSRDVTTGELHVRHCVTERGYYRGKPIFDQDQ